MKCSRADQAEAFARGVLDGAARDDFAAHATGCGDCGERVHLGLGSRKLLAELEPYEPGELEWRRIDRAVLETMGRPAERPRRSPWTFAVPAAVAAALAAAFALRLSFPRPPGATALVVAAGGEVFVTAASGTSPLSAQRSLAEGDRILTRSGDVLLQTGPATGVRVGPSSDVAIEKLLSGRTVLHLARGVLVAEVKPLARPPAAGDSPFVVRTPDLTVFVRGTAFRVIRSAGETSVEVARGTVALERASELVLVPAPQRAIVRDGEPLDRAAREPGASDDLVRGLPLGLPDADRATAGRTLKAATVTSDPSGARVEVDGRYRGVTPLSTLETPRPHPMRVAASGLPAAEMALDPSAPATHHVALAKPSSLRPNPALSLETPKKRPTTDGAIPIASADSAGLGVQPAPAPQPLASPEPVRVVPASAAVRAPAATPLDIQHQFDTAFKGDLRECVFRNPKSVRGVWSVSLGLRLARDGSLAEPVEIRNAPAFGTDFVDCVRRRSGSWKFSVSPEAAEALADQTFTFQDVELR